MRTETVLPPRHHTGGRGRRVFTAVATTLGTVVVVAVSVRHAVVFFTGGVGTEVWPHQGHHRDMVLITVGVVVALAGLLLPGAPSAPRPPAPSRPAAVVALVVLTSALVVDVSKTATLGFVLPGMREEYGLSNQYAGMLPVAGLAGTVLGSLLWGSLVDRLGVRRTLLLSTLGFISTSICGSMPTFEGNLVMCWLMGLAVGGLMPVVFSALTALVRPSQVPAVGSLIAGIATAGGYLLASQSAALLAPDHGWRSLWLVGAFTGGLLLLVLPLVPGTCDTAVRGAPDTALSSLAGHRQHRLHTFYGFMAGLMALGVLTWVPTVLRSSGAAGGAWEGLLAGQSWVALPVAVVLALALRHSAPQYCARVLALGGGIALVLFGLVILTGQQGWALTVSLTATVLFSNAMVASVVPMSSIHYASSIRGRGLGRIAGASKLGGLVGPLALATLVGAPAGFFVVSLLVGSGSVVAGIVMGARRPRHGRVGAS